MWVWSICVHCVYIKVHKNYFRNILVAFYLSLFALFLPLFWKQVICKMVGGGQELIQ